MPHLRVPDGRGAVDIYYQLHGLEEHAAACAPQPERGPRVLMLMGFAATHAVWAPQLADLLCASEGAGPPPMTVCVIDNRGVGSSGAPADRRSYSTSIMARDALAVLDHLGWLHVHVVGHSMGGMIACQLAAAAPRRVLSLSLIGATAGGWQAMPPTLRSWRLGVRMLLASSPEARAAVNVQFHFSPSLLAEVDPDTGRPRRASLIAEYVEAEEGAEEQPVQGLRGQLAAVFRHRVTDGDVRAIQSGAFPCVVIHGREDIIALPRYGRRLAARLGAPYIQLEGGHFVMREQAAAVNALLRSLALGKSFANVERYPFMPFMHWVKQVQRHRRLSQRRLAAAAEQEQHGAAGVAHHSGLAPSGGEPARCRPSDGSSEAASSGRMEVSRWWRPGWLTPRVISDVGREPSAMEDGAAKAAG